MANVRVREILKQVDEAKTSVIAFNCMDYNTIYSAVMAAEELRKPVILLLYPGHSENDNTISLSGFTAIVKELGKRVNVPIAAHLDHCTDQEYIRYAIDCGFTSVMYDGSQLPFEENLENTKRVVEYARERGVDVEGEIGHIGLAENDDQLKADRYTTPGDAAFFSKETGVTSLAVNIGSAHGVYLEEPNLDLQRLAEINAATDTPLVLHGGSGIPDAQLEIAFKNGINKFNFGTSYYGWYYAAIRGYCDTYGGDALYGPLPGFVQSRLIPLLKDRLRLSEIEY